MFRWLSPLNAAEVIHQKAPPLLQENLKQIKVLEVKTRDLCWSNKKIKSFLTVESTHAPCCIYGDSEYWRSIDNHNRTSEWYIGKMSLVLKNGWVQDSKSPDVDNRVRGYVLSMEDN